MPAARRSKLLPGCHDTAPRGMQNATHALAGEARFDRIKCSAVVVVGFRLKSDPQKGMPAIQLELDGIRMLAIVEATYRQCVGAGCGWCRRL